MPGDRLQTFTLKSSFANFRYFLPVYSGRKGSGGHFRVSLKDTVNNPASLDVALLAEMQLDELPKAAGVVVVDRLGVSESLHDGTAERRDGEAGTLTTNNTSLPIKTINISDRRAENKTE